MNNTASLLKALTDRADPEALALAMSRQPDKGDSAKGKAFLGAVAKAVELGLKNRNARIDVQCVRQAFSIK